MMRKSNNIYYFSNSYAIIIISLIVNRLTIGFGTQFPIVGFYRSLIKRNLTDNLWVGKSFLRRPY